MESHLQDERSWKVIQDIIMKQEQPISAAASSESSTAAISESSSEGQTLRPPQKTIEQELDALATNKD